MVLNLVGIQGHGGLMIKYAIHFQDEVKQCTRSLVQSLVKADVFFELLLLLGSITSSFTRSIGPVLKLK